MSTDNKGLKEIHKELATKCNVSKVEAIVDLAMTAQVTELVPDGLDEHLHHTVRSKQDRQQ